jgi:hypothetical protein
MPNFSWQQLNRLVVEEDSDRRAPAISQYFLHLKTADGALIEDPEGLELPSIEAAREEAVRGLRGILAETIQSGRDLDVRAVVVADSQGRELDLVPLQASLPASLRHHLLDA